MRLLETLKACAKLLILDEKSLAIVRWRLRRGDATLRLDYDLDENSVVFDVGGYRGDWASEIAARFNCSIHVFEPVAEYCALIRQRLGSNGKVVIICAGLAGENSKQLISVDEEGSSVEKRSANTREIELLDVHRYVADRGIRRIDLMKINIEGGEYGLLARMHEQNLIRSCTDLQIQFHDFVSDAPRRRQELREILARTHRLTYDYPFIWENWRRRAAE